MTDQPYHILDKDSPWKEMIRIQFSISEGKIIEEEGVSDSWFIRMTIKTLDGEIHELFAPDDMGSNKSLLGYMREFLKECEEKMGVKNG